MSYITVSSWEATDWSDEMEDTARQKYIPMVKSLGADSIDMVRCGNLKFIVVTKYPDEATAKNAQARVAEIRAQAAEELPTKMTGVEEGEAFASG